jgi:hypothetical protein
VYSVSLEAKWSLRICFIYGRVQVKIFISWLQYVVQEVVHDRQHVILNADETAIASVRHSGLGMASVRRRARFNRAPRPRDLIDRSSQMTTYLALVCDSADLQPLLPQVIMAKYTQHAVPPVRILREYSDVGFPFEFWHGTNGRVTPIIFRRWATRVRSTIGSFNPDAWIILIVDCATCHLCKDSISHLRRLGILLVIVPAKLTWLLQVLDVYAFWRLKRELREAEARARLAAETGQIAPGQWMKMATTMIRRHIVNRDWSDSFHRLGAGDTTSCLSSHLGQYLGDYDIVPALPSLAEFARLINRPAHSEITKRLHHSMMSAVLGVRRLPLTARPVRSATYFLPTSIPASVPETRQSFVERLEPAEVIDQVLATAQDQPVFLHNFQVARHFRPGVAAVPD